MNRAPYYALPFPSRLIHRRRSAVDTLTWADMKDLVSG